MSDKEKRFYIIHIDDTYSLTTIVPEEDKEMFTALRSIGLSRREAFKILRTVTGEKYTDPWRT